MANRWVQVLLRARNGVCRAQGVQGVGPVHAGSPLPVPVRQSQGLRVSGGDHEADGWGGQLVPCTVGEVPAFPVVPLQSVAVAP